MLRQRRWKRIARPIQSVLARLRRWVFSHRIKYTPQIDQALSVQSQCFHCSASCGSQSNDKSKVFIPGKVVTPPLLPWMVQRHEIASNRIVSFDFGVLMIVASLASECQIVQRRPTALRARDDVFDTKGLHSKTCLAATIFATASSTLCYHLSLLGNNARFRHK